MSISVVDKDSAEYLAEYNEEKGGLVPVCPFYLCQSCFETKLSMVGSKEGYTCREHPASEVLFSSENPNLSLIRIS